MPPDLLLDTRFEPSTRLMYGFLQLTPGFQGHKGLTRVAELAELTTMTPFTVRRTLQELHQNKWVEVSQSNKQAPVSFTLLNPAEASRELEVETARTNINEAEWEGQAIMREWLSLLVESDLYEDDAPLALAVNPYTDEKLEFDRYYPPRVAFEFQGPQHNGPTELFQSQEKAWRQQARDYMKVGICGTKGIELRWVFAQDLSLEGMKAKIGSLLPLRDLAGHEPLVDYLEAASKNYRRRCGIR